MFSAKVKGRFSAASIVCSKQTILSLISLSCLLSTVETFTTLETTSFDNSSSPQDSNQTTSISSTTTKTTLSSSTTVAQCGNNFICAGPVPVGNKGESCACPATYLNIGACCLSQNWIIGLACGSGGLLLLIFIAVVSWLCVTKSAAVAAANKMAAASSREMAAEIDTEIAYQHATANGHANHAVKESSPTALMAASLLAEPPSAPQSIHATNDDVNVVAVETPNHSVVEISVSKPAPSPPPAAVALAATAAVQEQTVYDDTAPPPSAVQRPVVDEVVADDALYRKKTAQPIPPPRYSNRSTIYDDTAPVDGTQVNAATMGFKPRLEAVDSTTKFIIRRPTVIT